MKSPARWIRYHGSYALRHVAILAGTRLPGPCGAQIQTINRCNGHCVMCPYSDTAARDNTRVMSEALYIRILEQLRDQRSLLWFSPTLQNEPLLDDALPERLRQARAILQRHVNIILVTNGSLLTPDRAKEIVAAGIDRIDISIDAFTEATYRRIRPGLDFGAVTRNTEALLAIKARCEVRVRYLRQRDNAGEESPFKKHWQTLGARVMALPCHNRRGDARDMAVSEDRSPSARRQLKRWARRLVPACLHPFAHLCVLTDGRVTPCCHDWTTDHIVGDLSKQSLDEVWRGPALNACREPLASWRYRESKLCGLCTIVTRHEPQAPAARAS